MTDGARRVDRRQLLKLGAAAVAGAGVAKAGLLPVSSAMAADSSAGEALLLTVEISGAPQASRSVREIVLGDVDVEHGEMDTGFAPHGLPQSDGREAACAPGEAHFGDAVIVVAGGSGKELHQWFDEAAGGQDVRKNITVTLYKSDRTPARSYVLHDCFPTQWSAVNFDTSSTVQTQTLTCKVGRIEFKT